MVEKLLKYDVEMCHCCLGEHMETVESSDGEFFKVEDVEPILNSAQQLKAEIAALIPEIEKWHRGMLDGVSTHAVLYKLRQLTSV